jgi:succinate dehydrogenase/fumarate reductase flavoprotein subunit
MKTFLRKVCFALLLLSTAGLVFAQSDSQSAKQDMKDAGHDTKAAAKKTGHAVKKTTKKAAHKTATKTKEGAQKVEDKTAPPQ